MTDAGGRGCFKTNFLLEEKGPLGVVLLRSGGGRKQFWGRKGKNNLRIDKLKLLADHLKA